MAPASEECGLPSVSEAGQAHDGLDPDDDVSPTAPPRESFCWRCCGCWQRRSRPPRGTDKVGSFDNETLLSGGKTRFYCCESKMTTRPGRGPNSAQNANNAASQPQHPQLETAAEVSPGLCSVFNKKGGRTINHSDEPGLPPVDIAFDAFDERAYLEEFEVIHREEYDVSRTITNPRYHRRNLIRHLSRRKIRSQPISDEQNTLYTTFTTHPVTPHSEILLYSSQVGRAITIKGKIFPHAQQFTVNLICKGKNNNSDIAMHFNPRLDRGYIARNTKLGNQWGVEENSLNGPSPFQRDKEFTLHMLITEDEYRFCHNGRHICSYKHRVPIARLHILEINGDLTLFMVRHEIMEEFPPPVPPVPLDNLLIETHLLSAGHTPLLIPTTHSWRAHIPKQSYFFLGRFEPNISTGNEIIIGGSVRLLPHAFFINLQDGLQMWRAPEVHLHINPRFEDHNHTIVNARLKGAWGFEERHARCRFQPGQPFTLRIRIENDRYRAIVNGRVLASMDYRAKPSNINSLYISGDVDITSVGYNTNLTTLKSTGTTKEGNIADDSDWVDENVCATRCKNDGMVPENAQEEEIPSVEIDKGNQILNHRKSERGSKRKKNWDEPEGDDEKIVAGENLDSVPSTSKAGKESTSNSGLLPVAMNTEFLPPEKNVAAVLVRRLGSRESLPVPALPKDSGSQDGSVSPRSRDVPAASRKDSNSRRLPETHLNGQPSRFETDAEGNPGLTCSAEIVASRAKERDREGSVVSDESVFLSAQHSLEPSIDSKRNSIDESFSTPIKTDREKKDSKDL